MNDPPKVRRNPFSSNPTPQTKSITENHRPTDCEALSSDMAQRSRFKLLIPPGIIVFAGWFFYMIFPGANSDVQEKRMRERMKNSHSCIENLRQLNGAVQQYMLENSSTNTPTDFATLDKYFPFEAPTECRDGGRYALPKSGSNVPTCSLGPTAGHVLY